MEKDDANEVTQAACIDDKWSSVQEITSHWICNGKYNLISRELERKCNFLGSFSKAKHQSKENR
jgi:hypothetical protein